MRPLLVAVLISTAIVVLWAIERILHAAMWHVINKIRSIFAKK